MIEGLKCEAFLWSTVNIKKQVKNAAKEVQI